MKLTIGKRDLYGHEEVIYEHGSVMRNRDGVLQEYSHKFGEYDFTEEKLDEMLPKWRLEDPTFPFSLFKELMIMCDNLGNPNKAGYSWTRHIQISGELDKWRR
jgi:hypothetical protein